jgi:hypothetical protein
LARLSFHAALDGFGYQTDEPQPTSLQSRPVENTEFSGWLASVCELEPNLAEKLNSVGISDEDSYLLREADLDVDSRYLAGLHRYEIIEGQQPNPTTIIEHLGSTPPWVLNASTGLLNLSIRSNNVCEKHEIKTIGDLAKYGIRGLHKLPNLGNKSIHEISREIYNLFMTGRPLNAISSKLGWSIPTRQGYISSDSNEDSEGLEINDKNHYRYDECLSANITDGFIKIAKKLTSKEQLLGLVA